MEKVNLAKQFACRLRDAMIAAGHNSHRSTSGICIHKLVEITGYSMQICRKYLRGEAIPEPVKLVEIAERLGVSPGWLLFGEQESNASCLENKLSVNAQVLHYIFTRVPELYSCNIEPKELARFLTELITDVALINADEAQSKKIIDLAIASARHFNRAVTPS